VLRIKITLENNQLHQIFIGILIALLKVQVASLQRPGVIQPGDLRDAGAAP